MYLQCRKCEKPAGLEKIGDQVSADPEDPANYDLFAGLEITLKKDRQSDQRSFVACIQVDMGMIFG